MSYFKLFAFVTSFFVMLPTCWAMDGQEKEPVKLSVRTISTMKDLPQYLGEESSSESVQKRAKVEDCELEGDLTNTLIVFDFDETLGNFVYTGLGDEFADKCRAYSCEMFREDAIAFSRAAKVLNISVDDYKRANDEWTQVLSAKSKYVLLEVTTKDLLLNLRKRGATLLVCSGNPNNDCRTGFLQSLGFNGKTDYFTGRDDKTRPVKNFLETERFSKVLFVDNRRQNVEDFVQKLAGALSNTRSHLKVITGLHYDYFHRTLTPELLVAQYRQLQECLVTEKQAKEQRHQRWLEALERAKRDGE